jgi:flagellar biosynthetic protein FliO
MAEAPSTFMLLVRLGLSLGLVLALVGAITWVLRRRGLLRPANRGTDGRLEVLDRKSLGKRSSLVVARVGGTAVLVGVTDTHISVLSEAPGLDAAWLDTETDGATQAQIEAVADTQTVTDPVGDPATDPAPEDPTPEAVPATERGLSTVGIDLTALEAAVAATARPTMGARRTGPRGDSPGELTTPTRMSFVETLRELTVRRS